MPVVGAAGEQRGCPLRRSQLSTPQPSTDLGPRPLRSLRFLL
jgi:hypothetical protein